MRRALAGIKGKHRTKHRIFGKVKRGVCNKNILKTLERKLGKSIGCLWY